MPTPSLTGLLLHSRLPIVLTFVAFTFVFFHTFPYNSIQSYKLARALNFRPCYNLHGVSLDLLPLSSNLLKFWFMLLQDPHLSVLAFLVVTVTMVSDDSEGLKKLEYLSLVSKVCTELESHTRSDDKVLVEFITKLGRDFENVEEYDVKLKENGAKMLPVQSTGAILKNYVLLHFLFFCCFFFGDNRFCMRG